MRKTSYAVTFILVSALLALNVISTKRVDWLIVKSSEVLHTRVTTEYGLGEICETIYSHVPSPTGDGDLIYRSYKCRRFPTGVKDDCDGKNRAFCAEWTSAGYVDQVAIGFGAVSLLAILFGVTTGSRRRRIWGVVSWLVFFQASCQLAAFAIITHIYDTAEAFEHARPGTGYILTTISWVSGFLIAIGVVTTGLSADSGHKWAAGNRAYHPIPGGD